jgi:hypothetical protein
VLLSFFSSVLSPWDPYSIDPLLPETPFRHPLVRYR